MVVGAISRRPPATFAPFRQRVPCSDRMRPRAFGVSAKSTVIGRSITQSSPGTSAGQPTRDTDWSAAKSHVTTAVEDTADGRLQPAVALNSKHTVKTQAVARADRILQPP